MYSYAWQNKNITPSRTVKKRYHAKPSALFFTIYACATVIVAPDVRSNRVLTRGRPQTFKCCVPKGGHTLPIAVEGTRLRWKNAQKNAKKNITSETINRIIPRRRPFCTFRVW